MKYNLDAYDRSGQVIVKTGKDGQCRDCDQ